VERTASAAGTADPARSPVPTGRTTIAATAVLVAALPALLGGAAPTWSATPAPHPPPPIPAPEPVPAAVPDTPDRPVYPVPRPAPPPVGTLAARIGRAAATVEALTERLVAQRQVVRQLEDAAGGAHARWAAATERYAEARSRAEAWARNWYLGATVPAPATDLLPGQPTGDAEWLGADLAAAARDVAVTTAAYARARRSADGAASAEAVLAAEQARRAAALDALRARYRAELATAQAITDTYDAALSRRYLGDLALRSVLVVPRAVQFALAQAGKPYVWGAEGPDSYDCSGLVQASYAAAGVALPRTARPQYLATVPVPVSALLPGDLLFFGPDPNDWRSIHHVAIYLGRGLMVHAPTTGDVVRIAPIWWAEFFGATRVTGAPAALRTVTVPAGRRAPAPVPRQRPAPAPAPAPAPSPPRRAPSPTAPPRPGGSPPTGLPCLPAALLPGVGGILRPEATCVLPAGESCPPPALTVTVAGIRLTLVTVVRADGTPCPTVPARD
jgi:cell wall-associated NlpC family hydrolase